MKELLDALKPPCPGSGIKITIDINLDDLMGTPKPPCPMEMAKKAEMLGEHPELIDKKIDMLEDFKDATQNSHELLGGRPSEDEPGGQSISFMGDSCPIDKPCPETGLGGLIQEIMKNAGFDNPKTSGVSKETVSVYDSKGSSADSEDDSVDEKGDSV